MGSQAKVKIDNRAFKFRKARLHRQTPFNSQCVDSRMSSSASDDELRINQHAHNNHRGPSNDAELLTSQLRIRSCTSGLAA